MIPAQKSKKGEIVPSEKDGVSHKQDITPCLLLETIVPEGPLFLLQYISSSYIKNPSLPRGRKGIRSKVERCG